MPVRPWSAPLPQIFAKLAILWWELSPALAATWWTALSRAQCPPSASLRQQFLLWESRALDLDTGHFVHRALAPGRVLETIENLVQENKLGRREATKIQDVLLTHVNRDGGWI